MATARGSSFSATSDPACVTPPFWKQMCPQTPMSSMSLRRSFKSYEPGAICSYRWNATATEQLVLVLGDDIAAQRAEVAIADEPLVRLAHPLHMRHLVLHAGGSIRGPQVGRFGEMRVAVDDLDAFEQRIEAARVGGVVHFANEAPFPAPFLEPIPLRVVRPRLHCRCRHCVTPDVAARFGLCDSE